MTADSGSHPTPRTLRDEIVDVIASGRALAWALSAEMPSTSEENWCAAGELLAEFDIRPHNEPAAARVPEDMTAEKLRAIARFWEEVSGGVEGGNTLNATVGGFGINELREWADEIAARDVGGDSPE